MANMQQLRGCSAIMWESIGTDLSVIPRSDLSIMTPIDLPFCCVLLQLWTLERRSVVKACTVVRWKGVDG